MANIVRLGDGMWSVVATHPKEIDAMTDISVLADEFNNKGYLVEAKFFDLESAKSFHEMVSVEAYKTDYPFNIPQR